VVDRAGGVPGRRGDALAPRPARRGALRRARPGPLRGAPAPLGRRGADLRRGGGAGLPARGGRRRGGPGGQPALGPRGGRPGRARGALGRDHPRRALPLRRPGGPLGAGAQPVGPARAAGLDRRRLRPARDPLHLRRSARSAPAPLRRLHRRCLAHRRRRRDLGPARQRDVRRVPAAGPAREPQRAGRPPPGPGAQRARRDLGAAPQRRLPDHRRRPGLERGDGHPPLQVRLLGGGPPARARHRLVRAGHQGREAGAGGRGAGGGEDARRRPDLRGAAGGAAAAPRLRPRLPPRPGGGSGGRAAGDGEHHREPLGERGRRTCRRSRRWRSPGVGEGAGRDQGRPASARASVQDGAGGERRGASPPGRIVLSFSA
jgi:hypothetical protein